MLVCTSDMSVSNAIGLLCAFGSAIVFVSQNIFFKKIVPSGPSAQSSHKLDKLNLLFYSSSMAFLLMIPIWLYHDLPALLSAQVDPAHVAHPTHGHATPHSVTYYFIANGTVHFAQNIIAFVILASTSPVTYSIASLIKRVAVICIAIVWFAQPVHGLQAVGITMTFVGLYMYNNAKGDVEKGEHKMRRVEAARDLALPTTKAELESDTEVSPGDVRADAIAPEPLAAMPEYSMGSAYGRLANAHAHPPPAVPAAPPLAPRTTPAAVLLAHAPELEPPHHDHTTERDEGNIRDLVARRLVSLAAAVTGLAPIERSTARRARTDGAVEAAAATVDGRGAPAAAPAAGDWHATGVRDGVGHGRVLFIARMYDEELMPEGGLTIRYPLFIFGGVRVWRVGGGESRRGEEQVSGACLDLTLR